MTARPGVYVQAERDAGVNFFRPKRSTLELESGAHF